MEYKSKQDRHIKQLSYSVDKCKWKYCYGDVLQVSFIYEPNDENYGLVVLRITTTSEDDTIDKEVYTYTLWEYTTEQWIEEEDKINFLLQKFNDYILRHPVGMKSIYALDLFKKIPSIISEENFDEKSVNEKYIRNILSQIKLIYQNL